jgi:hypothetical protein
LKVPSKFTQIGIFGLKIWHLATLTFTTLVSQVVVEAAPTLPPNTFSQTYEDFINQT